MSAGDPRVRALAESRGYELVKGKGRVAGKRGVTAHLAEVERYLAGKGQ